MTADEMFEKLGYIVYLDNTETLIYKHKSERFQTSITFDKRDYKKTFNSVESIFVPNNLEGWHAQQFKNDWFKYCSAQGHWENIWHEFSMQELKAINKKCKELRMDMSEEELQEKLNKLLNPEYLYQRYDGRITKYEILGNALIDVKDLNNIINTDNQILLGKTSKNIIDLMEVKDVFEYQELTEITKHCGTKLGELYVADIHNKRELKNIKEEIKNKHIKLISILTHEQYENNCYKVKE